MSVTDGASAALAVLLLAAPVALMAASPVAHADDPLDVEAFLRPCWAAEDKVTCDVMVRDLRKDWRRALRGDYQGQRNAAFCLRDGCSGAVEKNQVLSCAWRIVILVSGSPKVNDLDVDAFEFDCGRLSEGGRLAAKGQADYIIQRIKR